MKPYVLLLVLIPLCFKPIYSQIVTRGLPFISNYSVDDYQAHSQNWHAHKDAVGIMYFGNTGGLLQFDGTNWETIPISNSSTVRCMVKGFNDKIFVGGFNEVGYLEPNGKYGKIAYVSIKQYIPEQFRDFNEVWSIFFVNNNLYVCTFSYIFSFDSQFNVRVFKPQTKFHITVQSDSSLFVRDEGHGLYKISGSDISFINSTELLRNDRVYAALPLKGKGTLLVSRVNGLLIHNGQKLGRWDIPLNDLITSRNVYHAIVLEDNYLAFATLEDGIFIIDMDGNLIHHLTTQNGLKSNTVAHLFYDKENGVLWASQNDGISSIEIRSPFSIIDKNHGVSTQVNSAYVFRGNVFLGGTPHIQYCSSAQFGKAAPKSCMQYISKVPGQTWKLTEWDNHLFSPHSPGVVVIDSVFRSYTVNLKYNTWDIAPVPHSKDIMVSTDRGFILLEKEEGRWRYKQTISNFEHWARYFFFDADGFIWAYVYTKGIFKLKLSNDNTTIIEAVLFDSSCGVPVSYSSGIIYHNNRILVGSALGFFYFNSQNQVFEPYTIINSLIDTTLFTGIGAIDAKDNLICEYRDGRLVYLKPCPNNGFIKVEKPFGRLKGIRNYINFSNIDSTTLLLSLSDRNILVDLSAKNQYGLGFNTYIKSLGFISTDSALYFPLVASNPNLLDIPTFEYKNNSVQFTFGANQYIEPKQTTFSFILQGFDKEWSTPYTYNKKDYTNLPEGHYTFRVKAINIFGEEGAEDTFSFCILPPWYRSIWAIISYFLLLIIFIYIVVRVKSSSIKKANVRLERLVDERSKQLVEQAVKHEQQQKEFVEKFYTYISHEFRSPLTIILGNLEKMMNDHSLDSMRKHDLLVMFRNGQSMQRLVNQLLDYQKTENEMMELRLTKGDVILFVKNIAEFFDFLASKNQISYSFSSLTDSLPIRFDMDKMEKIIANLLSNAFKFTPRNGAIKIDLKVIPRAECTEIEDATILYGDISGANSDVFQLVVEDNGIGIAKERISKLFQHFYQANTETSSLGVGTGLGLALTKDLVTLHGGQIGITTSEGKGTRFTIRIPITSGNLCSASSKFEVTKLNQSLFAVKDYSDLLTADTYDRKTTLANSASVKILVVEDNRDVRDFIVNILSNDYSVFEAANGQEGLAQVKAVQPDLIVSDLRMPVMDGIEFCRRVKNDINTSHIPFILLTGFSSAKFFMDGFESGADDYIEKPFNTRIFELRIRNRLVTRENLRRKFFRIDLNDAKDVTVNPTDRNFLDKAIRTVEEHMADPEFNVGSFVERMAISKSLLHIKLRELVGMPANEFIRLIRLKRAIKLFRETDKNISEVAYEVGFSNPKYFSICFREQFGISPSKIDFKSDDLDIILTVKRREGEVESGMS